MEDTNDKPTVRPIVHGGYSEVWRKAVKGDLDGRSIVARAVKELKESLVKDLGGEKHLTVQKTILLDRVVAKTLRCQAIEHLMLEGEGITKSLEDQYLQTSNSLRKDLTALGLERVPINMTEEKPMEFDLKKLSLEELDQLRVLILKMESRIVLNPTEEELLRDLMKKQRGEG